jgi:hypothetical protein
MIALLHMPMQKCQISFWVPPGIQASQVIFVSNAQRSHFGLSTYQTYVSTTYSDHNDTQNSPVAPMPPAFFAAHKSEQILESELLQQQIKAINCRFSSQ